jgi:hypothetical protein
MCGFGRFGGAEIRNQQMASYGSIACQNPAISSQSAPTPSRFLPEVLGFGESAELQIGNSGA